MAEEKTEQPTPKKLRDARNKGQVARSNELVSAILVISMFGFLYMFGNHLSNALMEFILLPAMYIESDFDEGLAAMLDSTFYYLLLIMIPITTLGILVATLANFLQIGPIWSGESLMPKLEKISPIAGFKRIFCLRNFVEFLKSLVKLTVIVIACVYVITSNVRDLLEMPGCTETCIFPALGFLMLQLATYSSIAFLILAIFDVLFQKYEHAKGLRMTKDEIKREFKDTEGNPEIKGRRKSIHREITMNDDTPKAVKKSSVIISNPTHIAVALAYDGQEFKVPQIMAMGEDLLAKRIKDIAKENDIPVIENVPLARALYAQGEAGNPIPRPLFRAVAEILRAVRQLQQQAQTNTNDQKEDDMPSAY